jgi:hypothetical protein
MVVVIGAGVGTEVGAGIGGLPLGSGDGKRGEAVEGGMNDHE